MVVIKTRPDFYNSEEGILAEKALRRMAQDTTFNTSSTYSAGDAYTDNLIPFVDKHMNYLRTHPMIEVDQYLANVRLMTRIRPR